MTHYHIMIIQESFVNWDMNLGLKWTAEEYTNPQGITLLLDESLLMSHYD